MTAGGSPFSGAARFAEDTRRRFLGEILARVPLDRLVEVHLFSPIRQGGVETGVAVVAARRDDDVAADAARGAAEPPTPEVAIADAPSHAPLADPTEPAAAFPPADPPLDVEDLADVLAAAPPRRLTVFTARYRVAIRGPDRGRWDADVVAEADAPLVTVEAVVRGVQRRAGDAAGPERYGADGVARLVGAPPPA